MNCQVEHATLMRLLGDSKERTRALLVGKLNDVKTREEVGLLGGGHLHAGFPKMDGARWWGWIAPQHPLRAEKAACRGAKIEIHYFT